MSFVRLVSAEKHVFIVDRSVAQMSGLLSTILQQSSECRGGKKPIFVHPTLAILFFRFPHLRIFLH